MVETTGAVLDAYFGKAVICGLKILFVKVITG